MRAAALMLLLAGCAPVVSQVAICDATEQARTDHAAALAEEQGKKSVATGKRLIKMLDLGCKE